VLKTAALIFYCNCLGIFFLLVGSVAMHMFSLWFSLFVDFSGSVCGSLKYFCLSSSTLLGGQPLQLFQQTINQTHA
jgi:hypothetical protein